MSTSASIFDKSLAHWKEQMELPWAKLKYKLVQANLAKHIEPTQSLHILDAGGGNGLDSLPLARQGHSVEIVDYSQEMLADAMAQAKQEHVEDRVSVHQADVREIPNLFPEPAFDLVLCHNVLQYVKDVPGLLKDLIGTLKPGGLISIISINRYSIPYHAAFLENNLAKAFGLLDTRNSTTKIFETSMTCYSADEISAMLQENGLSIENDYGIRCMSDYWGDNQRRSDPATFSEIELLEFALTGLHPYKLLARNFQIIARKGG
jgi:S-adenosylmethionine-dependent methyltransferase